MVNGVVTVKDNEHTTELPRQLSHSLPYGPTFYD